jgi:hypothetical protein
MVVDALLSAEPHMHIAEQVDKPEKYIHLCDNIIQRIEMSEDPVQLPASIISLKLIFPYRHRNLSKPERF